MILGFSSLQSQNDTPNILFIIGDDMGVDALSTYNIGNLNANTPNLDALGNSGIKFTNVWAAPVCSATRASLITGKYGIHNGVNTVPGQLSTSHKSIFKEIKTQSNDLYKTCVIGKWHLARRNNYNHPFEHGVDDFMGVFNAGVKDYYQWEKYENSKVETCNTYATQYFTDYAIDWIKKQDQPWFMWLAHVAPHAPFQKPPNGTYNTENVNTNTGKYRAMIESLDYEIGRLLKNIPKKTLKNTVIVFLGDNGTPGRMVSGFPLRKGKGTVYQGGINVPLLISGKGVRRKNTEEDALINISDFYATFSQMVNPNVFPNNIYSDGISFKHLLNNSNAKERTYNFMSLGVNRRIKTTAYTVRNAQYKLIDNGESYEFYDLVADPFELKNLAEGDLNITQQQAKTELTSTLIEIRGT